VSKTHTALVETHPSPSPVTRSGNWAEDFDESNLPALGGGPATALATVALGFFVSTAVMNLDLPDRQERLDPSTVLHTAVTRRDRRLSLAEARQTALTVLAEAESRRAQFAEDEARRTAVWED